MPKVRGQSFAYTREGKEKAAKAAKAANAKKGVIKPVPKKKRPKPSSR